jgi:hypothetical protein
MEIHMDLADMDLAAKTNMGLAGDDGIILKIVNPAQKIIYLNNKAQDFLQRFSMKNRKH